MKAVLISIKPEWCQLIANGQKTVEVRKNRPKLETPFKCYIYCTKAKRFFFHGGVGETLDDLYRMPNGEIRFGYSGELMLCEEPYNADNFLNGKVIGEFVCERFIPYIAGRPFAQFEETRLAIEECACLGVADIRRYDPKGNPVGWHISELVIYDEPKLLSEFTALRKTKFGYEPNPLRRPPQSWCYVEKLPEV